MNNLLSTTDLEAFLKSHRNFVGVFPVDRIPDLRRSRFLIANLDKEGDPGTHWVAIFRTGDGVIEYFDSFGKKPPPKIKEWIDRYQGEWTYNPIPIQHPLSTKCGYFWALFVAYRKQFPSFIKTVEFIDKIL